MLAVDGRQRGEYGAIGLSARAQAALEESQTVGEAHRSACRHGEAQVSKGSQEGEANHAFMAVKKPPRTSHITGTLAG